MTPIDAPLATATELADLAADPFPEFALWTRKIPFLSPGRTALIVERLRRYAVRQESGCIVWGGGAQGEGVRRLRQAQLPPERRAALPGIRPPAVVVPQDRRGPAALDGGRALVRQPAVLQPGARRRRAPPRQSREVGAQHPPQAARARGHGG